MFNLELNRKTAKISRETHTKKVKDSMIYLMRECANKIATPHINLEDCFASLNHITHLSPSLHAAHHFLQASMRARNRDNAQACLRNLHELILNYVPVKSISLSSLDHSNWEQFMIAEAMRLTEEDCGHRAEVKEIFNQDLANAKDQANAALYQLARFAPDFFDVIEEHVQQIKLFAGKISMGFTDMRMMGAMLIRIPASHINPITYFLEHIIHETSHMHLNCLLSIDPIILNHPEERFISPLRTDLRPMLGVLHATFVSAVISKTFIHLYHVTHHTELLQPLAEVLDETIRGVEQLNQHARLTLQGQQLIASMDHLIESSTQLIEWKQYDFNNTCAHRFGKGTANITNLQKRIA